MNTINEGRRPEEQKKRGRWRKDGTGGAVVRDGDEATGRGEGEGEVPFERSCLLLVFDASEEIMLRGM